MKGSDVLDEMAKVRRYNLLTLVGTYLTHKEFLEALNRGDNGMIWSSAMLSSIIGPTPTRKLSERNARRIERALGLRVKLLDTADTTDFVRLMGIPPMSSPHLSLVSSGTETQPPPPSITKPVALKRDDAKLMMESLQAVMQAVDEFGNDSFNPGRHGRIVYLLYEDAKRLGYVDQAMLEQLLALSYNT